MMLDPETIVDRVQQGVVDSSWRVYRGRGSPIVVGLLIGIFAFLFISICEMIFLTSTAMAGIGSPSNTFSFPSRNIAPVSDNPVMWFANLGIVGLSLPAIAAIVITLLVGYRAARVRDSILVLLPGGVVQCTGISNSARRTFRVVNYAEVAQLRQQLRTDTTYNETTHTSSSTTRLWLDIRRHNGTSERWTLDSRFARPETIAQEIIAGHARYATLHP